jgi:hypothetical protein
MERGGMLRRVDTAAIAPQIGNVGSYFQVPYSLSAGDSGGVILNCCLKATSKS